MIFSREMAIVGGKSRCAGRTGEPWADAVSLKDDQWCGIASVSAATARSPTVAGCAAPVAAQFPTTQMSVPQYS